MITTVEVLNSAGTVLLTLPMGNSSNGYSVRKIDGLGPVKASLTASDYALRDGQQFLSARRDPRNIVIRLGLEPDYVTTTPESLRLALYQYFMPGPTSLYLRFTSVDPLTGASVQRRIAYIPETCEPVIFDKDPLVDISVMCYDPDFWNPLDQKSLAGIGSATAPANPLSPTPQVTLAYPGDVPTGLEISMGPANNNLTGWTLYVTNNGVTNKIVYVGNHPLSSELVAVSSMPGVKYIRYSNNSFTTYVSMIPGVSTPYYWPYLAKSSTTTFYLYAPGVPGFAMPYTIKWYNRHGGM